MASKQPESQPVSHRSITMPQILKLASAQVRTIDDPEQALNVLETKARQCSANQVDLVLFPEVFIGGFPRLCTFGAAIGSRTVPGYEQYLRHSQAAVDLGDTTAGAGNDWIKKTLPISSDKKHRGDGTRECLEKIATETGVFIVVGVLEKAGGTLYSSLVYVCPKLGIIGKRRKVMPTGLERLVWGQGSPSTLRAVVTTIKGVRLIISGALCWENWMPLLRQSLYEQNVNLFLAPTAHATDIWVPLMRTIGVESRAFVLTATPFVRANELPNWISEAAEKKNEVVSRGGSMIVSPMGQVLVGPVWDEDDKIITVEADFADCLEGRLDSEVAGSYTRLEDFSFTVKGLVLSSPA